MIERDSVLFKRACPFCGERIVLATKRDSDNTLYLVDNEVHICRDAPFAAGDEVRGFCFTRENSREVHGTIAGIVPYIMFEYHLDTGDVLGVCDEIYIRKGESNDA